jgi:thiol:disulfide interchange protein DsbD
MIDLIRNGKREPLAVEYSVEIPLAAPGAAVTTTALPDFPATTAAAAAGKPTQLWLMLLFAFLGGALLNVMPCVLPVVSIKVLSLVSQASLDRKRIRHHGLAYSAGILVSFAALATVVAVVKSGGEAVGWGFQFQSPLFVAVLAAVVFVFGLSLLDVFLLTAPAACTLEEAAAKEGLRGSFANGVFATVLATPCTAPFLGAAVGFAFTQPIPITFLAFLIVGVGLAFPFLLLAYFPAWRRFMPKPGPWMDTFKSVMGFVLMATVVWLLDVLGKQVGAAGLTRMLAWLGALGFAAWLWGRYGSVVCELRTRVLTGLVVAAIAVGGGAALLRFDAVKPAEAAGPVESGGIAWRPFSEKEVQRLAADGKTVFMDFTAAWCWTCKVNEKAVIETEPVRQALARFDVVPVRGDWTNRDPEIGAFLKRHGRAGVPVYAVLGPGVGEQPLLLPEVITQEMVIAAIEKAARR